MKSQQETTISEEKENKPIYYSYRMGELPKSPSCWDFNGGRYEIKESIGVGTYGNVEKAVNQAADPASAQFVSKRIYWAYYYILSHEKYNLVQVKIMRQHDPYREFLKINTLYFREIYTDHLFDEYFKSKNPQLFFTHNKELEVIERKAAKREAELLRKQFPSVGFKEYSKRCMSVIFMPKLPGSPLYQNKDGIINIHPDIKSNKDFLKITFRVFIETYFLYKKHGIIHGDLNPANIIKNNNDAYIIDFGLSRLKGELTSGKRGNTSYLDPKLTNSIPAEQSQDVYSLGYFFKYYDNYMHPYLSNTAKSTLLADPDWKSLANAMTREHNRISLEEAIDQFVIYFNKKYPEDPIVFTGLSDEKSSVSKLPLELLPPKTPEKISSPKPVISSPTAKKPSSDLKPFPIVRSSSFSMFDQFCNFSISKSSNPEKEPPGNSCKNR